MWNPNDPGFMVCIGLVAMLYSSVGHGGASGYLALLSMTSLAGRPASTLALGMNLGVSGISFIAYQRAKHFDFSLLWPFLVGSIPMAYVGGTLKVPGSLHKILIAAALTAAALWLILGVSRKVVETRPLNLPGAILTGVIIGLLSGIIGVGGGIFLSPILLLARWADAKKTASVSAIFILLNSISGLLARNAGELSVIGQHVNLIAVTVVMSLVGSALGAHKATNPQLRVILGVVLLFAVAKLVAS